MIHSLLHGMYDRLCIEYPINNVKDYKECREEYPSHSVDRVRTEATIVT